MSSPQKRILISRTDAIGDVMLTLPMAGILKESFPSARILFFGKTYTKAVIECCSSVDEFVNFDEFTMWKHDQASGLAAMKNNFTILML